MTLLLLSLFACSTEVACTDLAAYSTTVSVVDATGNRVVGITGTYTVDGGESKPCESWDAGELVCGVEEAGHFVISVSADGYEAATVEADVGADECHVIGEVLHVTLEEIACTAEVVASALVSVQAEDGTPLADSVVTYTVDGGATATCDASGTGSHTCGEDEVGQFVFEASAFGFQTQSASVVVEGDECHALTESVTITLPSNDCPDLHVAAVIVNLADAGGAELSNPAVAYSLNGAESLIACSDHGGGEWWCGSVIGEYVITATADGHESGSATASVVADAEGCFPVTQTVDIDLQWLPD